MGLTAAKPSLLKVKDLATTIQAVHNKIDVVIIANTELHSMSVSNLNAKTAEHILY